LKDPPFWSPSHKVTCCEHTAPLFLFPELPPQPRAAPTTFSFSCHGPLLSPPLWSFRMPRAKQFSLGALSFSSRFPPLVNVPLFHLLVLAPVERVPPFPQLYPPLPFHPSFFSFLSLMDVETGHNSPREDNLFINCAAGELPQSLSPP